MTEDQLVAYVGDEPYVFVCYAHSDSDVVYPELLRLQRSGVHVWFDEGISGGAVWRDELAAAIEGAALFLFYVSKNAVASHHCLKEVNYATDLNMPLLSVHIEPTTLPRGLRLAILDRQAIMKHSLARSEYEARLRRAIKRQLESRGETEHAPSPVDERSVRKDRIHVAISSSSIGEAASTAQTIADGIARYVSWIGGIYRPHQKRAGIVDDQAIAIDYEIDVKVSRTNDSAVTSWFVHRADTAEVVWASQAEEAPEEFDAKCDRIAETIAEGAISAIADHEAQHISGLPLDELNYSHLLLTADQLNYHDPVRFAERLAVLKRAIDLEPNTGLAHGMLATLLSWKIINGVSSDAAADKFTLLEEAALALRYDPNEPFVLLAVGTAFCRIGEFDRGLGLIRRAHSMAPTIRSKDELARSLCFAGKPDEAIPLFEEILATMPAGHTFPYVRLAIAYVQAGRLDDAVEQSSAGTIHFSGDYYSWLVHSNVLALLGRSDEAHAALAEARRLLPKISLATVIERTEATYGHTEQQRHWLTGGLRALMREGET